MRSKYLLIAASICLLSSTAFANSEHIRTISRITALWKDAQIDLVKEQAEAFLNKYPNDEGAQIVRMALADSYRQSKEYEKTLTEIQKIPEPEQTLDIKLIYIDALYQLKNYSAVRAHTKAILNVIDFESNVDEKKALISAYAGLSLLAQYQSKTKPDPQSKDLQEAYSLLTQTELCPESWRLLVQKAQIEALRLQGRFAEAGQKASDLAQRSDADRGTLLFIAAQCFAHGDPENSIEIYENLIKEEGDLAQKAAEGLMRLLIQKEDYAALIDARHMLKKSLPQKAHDSLAFFLAEAYFQKEDYLKVFHLLKEPLKQITALQKRRMHVLAGYAAHKIGNASQTKEHLDALFEQRDLSACETELALIYAKRTLEDGDSKSAERTIVQLQKRRYPKEKKPSLDLVSAIIAYQSKRIDEAFNLAMDLIEEGSLPEKDRSLLNNVLSACAKDSASNVKGAGSDILERFMVFVEMEEGPKNAPLVLSYLDVLLAYSKFEKMHYFLNHLSIDQISFSDSELFNLEIKKALACEKMKRFDDEVSALKRAYKAAETLGNTERMQSLIYLFNANFRLHKMHAQQNAKSRAQNDLILAAQYLRSAYELEPNRIDPRNKRWLAYFYSDYLAEVLQNTNSQPISTDEATRAYATLISISQDTTLDPSDQARITLATVKLGREGFEATSALFHYEPDQRIALRLVKKGAALNQFTDHESQKLKSALYLEAGRTYHAIGSLSEAKECFEKAIRAIPMGLDADLAKLFLCRIQLAEKTIEPSKAVTVLKDLQHKKTASHEPLFFEAALDYIDASCMDLEGLEKTKKKLFLLTRLKEDFSETRSAIGKSYHETLKKLPNKKALYEKYMGFVGLEIAYLKLCLNAQYNPEAHSATIREIQSSIDTLSKTHVKTESFAQIDYHIHALKRASENFESSY